MSDILPSLLGAGSGLFSGVGSILGQSSANHTNIKLQQQQQQYDTQMWHMNNDYNSPAAQMSRLNQAGINPFQALGSSGVSMSSGSSSSPPQGVAPAQVNPVNFGNVFVGALEGFLNAMTTQSQSIKALADANASDRSRFLIPGQIRLQDSDFHTNLSQQGALNSQSGLFDQEAANLKQENDFRVFTNSLYQQYGEQLTKLQIKQLGDYCSNLQQDTKLKAAQTGLTKQQAQTEIAKQVDLYAHAHNLNVDSQSIAAMIVPTVTNIKANTLETISRVPRNVAQARNINNDTQNNNMTDKERVVTNTLGNMLTLGTGAWTNNAFKPKPARVKHPTYRVQQRFNSHNHFTGSTESYTHYE